MNNLWQATFIYYSVSKIEHLLKQVPLEDLCCICMCSCDIIETFLKYPNLISLDKLVNINQNLDKYFMFAKANKQGK